MASKSRNRRAGKPQAKSRKPAAAPKIKAAAKTKAARKPAAAPKTKAAPKPKAVAAPARVAMAPDWQNISDPVFHWAAQRPEAPAFHQGPETLTYGQLAPLVGKAAVHLDSIGIRAGERVAINLTNSIDHFILTLALLRIGATVMEIPYNTQQPPSANLLGRFAVRTAFIEPVAQPIAGFNVIRIDSGWRSLIARSHGDRRHGDNGDGIFTITLTSGTTGQHKGSVTTHRQYFQRLRAYTELFAETGAFSSAQPANFLLAGNIGFSTFFRRMISQLFIGGPTVILPDYLHAIDLVKAIRAWGDAACFVTTAMCRFLISCAPEQGVHFPRLRALVAGGGYLYPQEKLVMLDRVSPNFYESYGTSGFGTVAVLSPREMRERPASVGRPPSFVHVQVVDGAGQPLAPGVAGQLRCRGTEGKGFAAEVDPTSDERFRDGWYYPGDAAHLDEAGYIFLKGRSADVIHRHGLEIFSADIEAVIAEHPVVAEVAVVGVPRAASGEDLVALIVPRGQSGQAEHESLAQHCQARLPLERRPDGVFYAPALPKTAAGKLDRARVRAMLMDEIARRAAPQPSPAVRNPA
jgi:acyl-coenzyme A synthetase/AMP-(fatty) acid ligase